MRKYKDGLSRVCRFTEARKTKKEKRRTSGIFMTSIYSRAKSKRSRQPKIQICRRKLAGIFFQPVQLHIHSFCSPTLPALCDVCLCPLGATISPSNSFQLGIHTASPIPFSDSPKPRLLQRDRQLVRLGEVAFDVPGFAEASLFAHIKAEEI